MGEVAVKFSNIYFSNSRSSSPSPVGSSSLLCCSLLEEEEDAEEEEEEEDADEEEEEEEEDIFVVWVNTASRSFSISINFLFRASISLCLRRSSTWTRAKPSSHSLLISSTAAWASCSMTEVNLLWKAAQWAMVPPQRWDASAGCGDVDRTGPDRTGGGGSVRVTL